MSSTNPARAARPLHIAIIGAGMSGILAAIKLREAGHENIVIFEKAASLGGTWRENTYPGLTCDVPSHHYVYAFEPNPEWSHQFSPGPEICAYFQRVADKHGIAPLIRFNSEVLAADWLAPHWQLRLADGQTETFDIVISATGPLHHPRYPDIEGLEDFGGACFHTARWDHDVVLDDKRIGIVGTGSTAIQIVPAIVDRVRSLALFQRTAQWVLPLPNPAYSEAEKAEFRAAPEKMAAIYKRWKDQFNNTFARAVLGDEKRLGKLHELCQANLDENVHDPALKAKLTPDYTVACKRLVMSAEFYPAIQKPNASVVTTPIERVVEQGIETADGTRHELDVLVLATGFNAHQFMRPMVVTGENGRTLDEAWADSNQTYRSVAVPEFPNFFLLIGPNSPIGNFSLIMIAERQVDYLRQLIDRIASGACQTVAPRPDAAERFGAAVKDAMHGTVWVSGCSSWYLDKNGTPVTWPWDFERFENDMRAPDWTDFRCR